MQKKIFYICLLLLAFISLLHAEDLSGFWQTIDKKTHLPSSVIAIYFYQGKYFGKIVATCNSQGEISETLYQPQTRAPGIAGNPHYCGLDIIWSCAADGQGVYKGHVVDPREGKRYNAKIWLENNHLILRGEVWMFGRNESLVRLPQEKWNVYFAQLNLNTLIPAPYKLKR